MKIRLDTGSKAHGGGYWELAGKLFNYESIPMYVVINSDGDVTAFEPNIDVFGVSAAGGSADTAAILQRFLDTAKGKGEAFDFDKGFLRPQNAP